MGADLLSLVARHVELKRKTSREWAGPCPVCHGTDRFLVWPEGGEGGGGRWLCRGCGRSGGPVGFLRLVGRSCPDAHLELGEACRAPACPAAEKCRLRRADRPAAVVSVRPLVPPGPSAPAARRPAPAAASAPPADAWVEHAGKFLEAAEAALLSAPERLEWLASRGIPPDAARRYRLGWSSADAYRARAAWGLPELLRDDGKPKKLLIPAGVVIPAFDDAGRLYRLRVRRDDPGPNGQRYYQVPGSGVDPAWIGSADAAAAVVVEADLDAFAIHAAAGDLVAVLPLGSADNRPRNDVQRRLEACKTILVALDYDAAGARSAKWWLAAYPRAAVRWPVPAAKDPGDWVKVAGGSLRGWVLAGLPAAVGVSSGGTPSTAAAGNGGNKPKAEDQKGQVEPAPAVSAIVRGVSRGGVPYLIAPSLRELAAARAEWPDAVGLLADEVVKLGGAGPEEAASILEALRVFPGARVVARRNLQKEEA